MKRRNPLTIAAMLIVGVSLTMAPVSAQEATQEDFRELCSAFAGRWVSDIQLSMDVDGIGKQGDEVPFYSEFHDENNGHLLVGKMFTGTGSATWILAYDQGAKRIRAMFVTSGGGTDTAIVYKRGEDWYQEGEGTLSGDRNTFKHKIAISDEGNTHTWTMNQTVAGKKLPETTNVYQRLTSHIPDGGESQEFQEFGEAIVGLWECDVTFINDWPDQKREPERRSRATRSIAGSTTNGRSFESTTVGLIRVRKSFLGIPAPKRLPTWQFAQADWAARLRFGKLASANG